MNIEQFGLTQISPAQLEKTEGGFLPLVLLAAAAIGLLNSSYGTKKGYQVTVDCNNCKVTIHGDSVIITK